MQLHLMNGQTHEHTNKKTSQKSNFQPGPCFWRSSSNEVIKNFFSVLGGEILLEISIDIPAVNTSIIQCGTTGTLRKCSHN